jgi:hypothetical protein
MKMGKWETGKWENGKRENGKMGKREKVSEFIENCSQKMAFFKSLRARHYFLLT